MATTHPDRTIAHDALKAPSRLVAALVFGGTTVLAAVLGGLANAGSVDGWYAQLERPWFAPPNSWFGPVWTVLYVTIAFAGWLVWERRGPLRTTAVALWGTQLGLNLAWSVVFFGLQSMAGGMVVIVALWLSIVGLMLVAGRHRPAVSWLLLPYVAWVTFAAVLNAGYLALN